MSDLMPYEHIAICAKLQNDIDNSLQEEPEDSEFLLDLSHDEADVTDLALMLYKSVLIDKYRDKLRQEIDERINDNANT